MSNIEIDKPFADWTWSASEFRWKPPMIKLSENNFNSVWIEDKQKWISECKIHEDNTVTGFQIWKAKPLEESSPFNKACSSTEYMIQSMQEVTHNFSELNNLVSISVENEIRFPTITKHMVLIDLAPIAFITYSECSAETKNEFNSIYRIHPQSASRTIHELFRLIIEWAWCFTELKNNEPMAELCHDILRVIQMPINIRNYLLSIRPQQISKYLINDINALQWYEEDSVSSDEFKEWISDVYYNYRPRYPGCPLNVNTSYISNSYPM